MKNNLGMKKNDKKNENQNEKKMKQKQNLDFQSLASKDLPNTKPRKPEINVLKFSILPIIFSMTTLTWQPPPNMSWWGSLEVK